MVESTLTVQRLGPTCTGCVLRVVSGSDRGKTLLLGEGGVDIGKHADCGFVLTDDTVSGRHVRVEVTGDGLRVIDLGSTNGTLYMETRVHEVIVAPGAVLTLGNTVLALSPLTGTAVHEFEPLDRYGSLLGRSQPMQELYARLGRLERVEHTALILGETGTGKELVAREIHAHSPRRDGPYAIVDCGAVPKTLIESELFGHLRGAFTGADRERVGVFESADGGTVFLDEIGELPLELQPKLLRVLENRTVRALGDNEQRSIDVRVLAATNRDLRAEVEARRFRSDLYYRLTVVELRVPPLRERRDDIATLVRHFVGQLGDIALSAETLELLASYDWPGNVRELRNAVMRLTTLGSLPEHVVPSADDNLSVIMDEPFLDAKKRLVDAFERDYLAHQLKCSDNNIAEAARLAGLDRSYMRRLLARHGLLP